MVSDTADSGWRRGDPIGYIQEQTPEVPMPAYRGKWHDDMVPDTLDLAERAALGVNGLTGPTDPDADYEVYWWVDFFRNPPVMVHGCAETGAFQWAKFVGALPLGGPEDGYDGIGEMADTHGVRADLDGPEALWQAVTKLDTDAAL